MIAMLTQYIDMIAKVIEFIGVMIMVLGLVFALYQTLRALGSFNQAVYHTAKPAPLPTTPTE